MKVILRRFFSLMTVNRIDVSAEALELIRALKAEFGNLVFHQSGGCCDGSSPMCFQKDDFKIGYSDVGLGVIDGCEFWMSKDQFEYWKHTHITLDVVKGRGSSFSIEIPTGWRFMIRSRLFTDQELANLSPLFFRVD